MGKKLVENNDTVTEYAPVEDRLNIHQTASCEPTFASEIPNITRNKTVIIAQRQEKENSFNLK